MNDDTFIWFGPGPTARLREKLNSVGEGAGIKLTEHPEDKFKITVVDANGESHDPINDSHICPGSPGCP